MDYYRNFSAQDFALDARFQKWVLAPDEETIHFWNELMRVYPQIKEEVERARELINVAGLSSDHEANIAYLNVWENLKANVTATAEPRQPSYAGTYLRWAAVFAGLLVAATYFLWNMRAAEPVEFRTAFGEVREVVLDDGSKVTLNSNSYLKYSSREAFLQGEAFFEVARTTDRKKFLVNTPETVSIEVLGTEFNVSTRRQKTEVYLQAGKVRMSSAADKVVLKPGEQASFNKNSNKIEITRRSASSAEGMLGWMKKLFVYNDASLSSIASDIEDRYGLTVVLTDPTLAERKFTGTVPAQKVDVLLKVLAETLEIAIEQQGDQIIIRPQDG